MTINLVLLTETSLTQSLNAKMITAPATRHRNIRPTRIIYCNNQHNINMLNIQCKKKVAPPTFCNIFGQAKCISMKFCQYVASLYPHISTNFGWFILIFNKMALIFLGVLVVFIVSSFEFHQVKLPWLHRQGEWLTILLNSIHWIIRFEGNAGVLLQAATEATNSSRVYRCI